MTTRIAKLYLPVAASALLQHQGMSIEDDLLASFGGFTSTISLGAWRNPTTGEDIRESVYVYEIAMDEDVAHGALLGFARKILLHTHEDCVMFVDTDGEVSFVDQSTVRRQPAAE